MDHLEQIISAIRRGQLKKSLELLGDFVQSKQIEDSDIRNAVINLSARYHQLQRRRLSSLISEGEAQITENQIRYSTLEVVDIMRDQMKEEHSDKPDPRDVYESIRQNRQQHAGDEGSEDKNQGSEENHKKQIIFLASSPVNLDRVYFDMEILAINKIMRLAGIKEHMELNVRPAVKPNDVGRLLLDHEPYIVHFSGHGNEDGLYFENATKGEELVDSSKLERIFGLFTKEVKVVFLSACFSAYQAEAIAKHIDFVIGTKSKLESGTAVDFAKEFYLAFGRKQDVEFAFKFAKAQLELNSENQDQIVLFKRRN